MGAISSSACFGSVGEHARRQFGTGPLGDRVAGESWHWCHLDVQRVACVVERARQPFQARQERRTRRLAAGRHLRRPPPGHGAEPAGRSDGPVAQAVLQYVLPICCCWVFMATSQRIDAASACPSGAAYAADKEIVKRLTSGATIRHDTRSPATQRARTPVSLACFADPRYPARVARRPGRLRDATRRLLLRAHDPGLSAVHRRGCPAGQPLC